jgi:cobalt-zinc-cadmium efflux system outer membrane protein
MKQLLAAVIAIAIALACATRPAHADEAQPRALSLDDVVRAVVERHPLVRAAELEQSAASADLLSAEGGFDPSFKARATSIPTGPYTSDRVEAYAEVPTSLWGTRFFAGYRVSRGAFPIYEGKLVTGEYGEARAGVQVPLWRDGPIDRRRAALRRAELGIDAARLGVGQQRIEMVRSASLKYWDWVAAGHRVNVARDNLAIAVTRDSALAIRVEHGDIPAFERAENERVIHQRTASVAAAERAFQNASIELSLFLRDPDGSPIRADASRVPGAFPDITPMHPDARAAEESALSRRPELRRVAVMTEQARVDRDLWNNQRKLALDVVAAGAKDFGAVADARLGKPELELSLLVDIPLWTRTQDGRVQAADATLARLAHQGRFARDRVVADVRDARSAVDMAVERIAATRKEVVTSRQLVQMERQRFELGEGTLLIVNLREQNLVEAQQREIDAVADYLKAVVNERAAGGLSDR